MKHSIALGTALTIAATTAGACPWSGGSYHGNELNFRTEFTVNDGCTEMVFQSSGSAGFQEADTPATLALGPKGKDWTTEINSVAITLVHDGKWVHFIGPGINRRLHVDKRK